MKRGKGFTQSQALGLVSRAIKNPGVKQCGIDHSFCKAPPRRLLGFVKEIIEKLSLRDMEAYLGEDINTIVVISNFKGCLVREEKV